MKVHSIRDLLRKRTFFPKDPAPSRIVLSFHPRYSQFEPFALAMLAAWATHWRTLGVEIICENTTAKGVAYAQRLGLFRFLGVDLQSTVDEHEESGRFVELQRIRKQADLTKLIADLGALLRVPELIEVVQYVVAEMTRNVLEHADAEAFVCVQHYKLVGRVSIGIADTGTGVRRSLERAFTFNTDGEAVIGSLRPGVSGTTLRPYGSADNAGLGLFYARGLAKWTNQYFLLLSGDAAYRLKHKQPTRNPARDPREDAHDLYENLGAWQGTVVAIDVGQTNTKFNTMFKRIGTAALPDDGVREAKNRIRFT